MNFHNFLLRYKIERTLLMLWLKSMLVQLNETELESVMDLTQQLAELNAEEREDE